MRSPGTVISGGFPGRVAQEVTPNPKCHGCLHYDGQGGRTGVCTVGLKPAICGEGELPEFTYAPIARGAGAYLHDMNNHAVQAREVDAQSVGGLYGAGSTRPVQFQVVTLGDEHAHFIKSFIDQHMEVERKCCRLHQGHGLAIGSSPYHNAPQSCSCVSPTDVMVAKALLPRLSNRERVALDVDDVLDFVRAFGDVKWTGGVKIEVDAEKGMFHTPVGKYETSRGAGGAHHVDFHPHEGAKQRIGSYPSANHARHALITHARRFASGSGEASPVRTGAGAGPAEKTGKMKKPGRSLPSMSGAVSVAKPKG